jgi:hypothetical protein
MKKILLVLVLVAFTVCAYAADESTSVESVDWLTIGLKVAGATLAGALITAANHLVAFTFNLKLWFEDTAMPALVAFIVTMILALIDVYVKVLDGIIESIFGAETDINNIPALVATAILLVPIIKGYFKRKETKVKVAKAA